MRADLDKAQRVCGNIDRLHLVEHFSNEVILYGAKTARDAMVLLPALVAELRAARKVMGPASAIYEDGNYDPVFFAELGDALDAYDKVTGEVR